MYHSLDYAVHSWYKAKWIMNYIRNFSGDARGRIQVSSLREWKGDDEKCEPEPPVRVPGFEPGKKLEHQAQSEARKEREKDKRRSKCVRTVFGCVRRAEVWSGGSSGKTSASAWSDAEKNFFCCHPQSLKSNAETMFWNKTLRLS